MGTASSPSFVKLITALLGRDSQVIDTARRSLKETFGPIDSESAVYPFTFSEYYDREMGAPLVKQFVSFADLINPGSIAGIKKFTNEMEQTSTPGNGQSGRTINIDPGYLNDAKLILATTKDFSHRIYLSDGIYAETTLEFRKGAFRKYPWTYPDYQSDLVLAYFSKVRDLFMEQR